MPRLVPPLDEISWCPLRPGVCLPGVRVRLCVVSGRARLPAEPRSHAASLTAVCRHVGCPQGATGGPPGPRVPGLLGCRINACRMFFVLVVLACLCARASSICPGSRARSHARAPARNAWVATRGSNAGLRTTACVAPRGRGGCNPSNAPQSATGSDNRMPHLIPLSVLRWCMGLGVAHHVCRGLQGVGLQGAGELVCRGLGVYGHRVSG
jgi:hypothetical protein